MSSIFQIYYIAHSNEVVERSGNHSEYFRPVKEARVNPNRYYSQGYVQIHIYNFRDYAKLMNYLPKENYANLVSRRYNYSAENKPMGKKREREREDHV